MNKSKKHYKRIKGFLNIVCWLILWEILAQIIHSPILLVGPMDTLRKLLELIIQLDFYEVCAMTLLRISLGITAGIAVGMLLGILAHHYTPFKEFLFPFVQTIKAIPIASFVILLLIWTRASWLSSIISFLVVFPSIYIHMLQGLASTSQKLLDYARIFQLSNSNKYRFIYAEAVFPYLESSLKLVIGMAFKSGIAAEVIGLPNFAIGEQIYMSKVYIDTASLFAWTVTLIVLSYGVEKAILYLLHIVKQNLTKTVKENHKKVYLDENLDEFEIQNLSIGYEQETCLDNISKIFKLRNIYICMGPSGFGKTTMLNTLSGLLQPISGNIQGFQMNSYIFQECCFVENASAMMNIQLVNHSRVEEKHILDMAAELKMEDAMDMPMKQLSGGMRKRISLMIAIIFGYGEKYIPILLDEPFSGMDERIKRNSIDFLKKYQKERILIITSHEEEDIQLLGGQKWNLNQELR